ncbi:PAS domain-containing hybrid sensor histidine kinase/response regulator [Tritonibacter horizontis]|uniref:histidine kinase n=1 Tax=Tritonibacter horizontis TaxID=1768241 RepID=A0A132BQJ1_9RHOB|nr:PAS domain S-box protein [Tritonibacter horizontis]KUP90679.1 blue-light-activated protein [Tritonibacter horizontis]
MSVQPDPFPQGDLQSKLAALDRRRRQDARELKISRALLDGIQAMCDAADRDMVFAALDALLKSAIGAKEIAVVGNSIEGFLDLPHRAPRVLFPQTSPAELDAQQLDWYASPRDVKDLRQCRDPTPRRASGKETGSLITTPHLRQDGQFLALMCWHPSAGFFDAGKIAILERVITHFSHALRGLQADDCQMLLASVLEQAEVPVMLVDPDHGGGEIVFANHAFEEMTGHRLSDGSEPHLIAAPLRPGIDRDEMEQALNAGQQGRFRIWNTRGDGKPFLDDISLTPIRSSSGTLRYMMVTHSDVTEQSQTQQTVKRLEKRIEYAMEAVTSAILATEADGTILYANKAMQGLLREMYGPGLRQRQIISTFCKSIDDGLENQEVTCKDGTVFLIRSFYSNEGGRVITGTDVTEIKRAERKLKQRAAAMDSTTEGIAIVELDARITYANPAFARIFGTPEPTAVLNKNWSSAFLPEDVEELLPDLQSKVETEGSAQIEMRVNLDGDILSYEVCVTRIDDQMRIVVARDITRRIEYENARRSFEKKLHDFEKNESIGRLAAGVAHDFNNLLAVINGHSALLNERTPPEKVQLYSARINEASSRAAKMINRFLDLGMSADSQNMIDLRNLMTESQDLLQSALSADTTFTLEMGEEEMEMLCYPSDLLRVALNLVQNAQDALGGKPGQICQYLTRHTGADLMDMRMDVGPIDPDLSYACYAVHDSGSGVPPEVRKRLFREHCSTKGQRGSGIGMMAIAEIIRSHDGAIRLLSDIDQGTRVEIYLPLSDYSVARASEEDIGTVRLDGQLVLLVDDDAQVAESIAAFLERLGAEVSICLHPDEALAAIEEDPGMWSFLVSDYNMPGQNGGQLARAAKTADGDLPIVIVTALARKLSDPNLTEDVINALLGKPVDLNALAHLIAQHGRSLFANNG